jgi:phosphatidylinositol alpha-1,6-mannosyltransferase
MRTLLIANVFPPVIGGSATVYQNLCARLEGEVAAVAPKRDYQTDCIIEGWQESDSRMPFPVHRVERLRAPVRHAPAASILGSAWRLLTEDVPIRSNVRGAVRAFIQGFRPDVICLGDLSALSWLGSELQKKGLPVLQFIHGEELIVDIGSRRLRREVDYALRHVDGIVAVSSYTKDRLIATGVEPSRVHLILNGVDTTRFQPGPRSAMVEARHGLQGKKVLLTFARVLERKGHDMMIRALPQVLAVEPETVYLIAGSGPDEGRLRDLAQENGVTDHVRFAGVVPDAEAADYYRTCDIFAMPNRKLRNGDTEGFGLVFLEAGACGRPVIGGRDGGVPDAVAHNQTGLLVDGNSVDEIAQAAIRLLRDPALASAFGAAGLERARRSDWRYKAEEFRHACEQARARGVKAPVDARSDNLPK